MPFLLLHGNINHHTFANTIIVANEKAKELFGIPLDKIFVIHSKESEFRLIESRNLWTPRLAEYDIDWYEIEGKVIELSEGNKTSIDKFVKHIEFLFNGTGGDKTVEWMVDLTNGTSIQKNLLSISSYILDIKHQYMINISVLNLLTQERGFLPLDILLKSYEPAPDSTLMDSFAYLDLSEIVRYKRVIEDHRKSFSQVAGSKIDDRFFQENLIHAVKFKLEADRKKDNALSRIATTSIAASLEELVSEMIGTHEGTLGKKLLEVKTRLEKTAPESFDLKFFGLFNELMLYLRNSTTHKGKHLTDVEKFKADLALKLSFPFVQFYSEIVHPLLQDGKAFDDTNVPKKMMPITDEAFIPKQDYFYGLDGDNTGGLLEGLFLSKDASEKGFKSLSEGVSKALGRIEKAIKAESGTIIFNAGDDLLFKGQFSMVMLKKLQEQYLKDTGGNTCSIAFGKTLQETYLAMKLAKATPGKNTIMGIELLE